MRKPRRPENGEDVRRRLLLFLAATDGLSPREIADALERTAAGEYGTAVEAICSGLHENNSRISGGESENLTNLVLTLGLPEACSNRVIEQTDAKTSTTPSRRFQRARERQRKRRGRGLPGGERPRIIRAVPSKTHGLSPEREIAKRPPCDTRG